MPEGRAERPYTHRPSRRPPPLLKIARYWHELPDVEEVLPNWPGLWIGLGEPFCAACGWLVPALPLDLASSAEGGVGFPEIWRHASKWLERAHIITRSTDSATGGGLDVVANHIQLCQLCHKSMPWWNAGDEDEAMEWLRSRPHKSQLWQLFTDCYNWPQGRISMTNVFLFFHSERDRALLGKG